MSTAPTGLLGYRAFYLNLKGYSLRSIAFANYTWKRQNTIDPTMTCMPYPSEHPSQRCDCGFHAFYDFHDVQITSRMRVHGVDLPTGLYGAAVVGSGRVVLAERGWRAEKAEIVAILSTQNTRQDRGLRLTYDVPVVPTWDDLKEVGERHGTAVSKASDLDHVPAAEEPPCVVTEYTVTLPVIWMGNTMVNYGNTFPMTTTTTRTR